MDLILLRIFQRQVEFQCKALLKANRQLEAALKRGDMEEIWASVQSLLNAAANISKALWGQSGKFAEERAPLRKSIGVTNASLLKKTGMRNSFEHYDERLDDWWQTSKSHNHVDMNVMPTQFVAGYARKDVFRNLDPVTRHLTFWGQSFDLPAIVQETERLLLRVSKQAHVRALWEP